MLPSVRFQHRSFDVMTVSDLGRAEDAYESFVILAMADHAVTRNDIIGLRYCYGRGVNSGDPLTPEQFSEDAAEFWSSILAIDAFAETQNSSSLIENAFQTRRKICCVVVCRNANRKTWHKSLQVRRRQGHRSLQR